MPRIYPLFSSSSGNCTYIGSGSEGILVDCGASFTKIKNALLLNGLDMSCVKAIFITHDHSDHIKGLKVLTKKTGIPVYSQSGTLDSLYDMGLILSSAEDIKDHAEIGSMKISCFPTSHDTLSCGYRITFEDDTSCAVCTDLGYVSDEVRNGVSGCSAVLIEANYDPEMLRLGDYPAHLKARIRSDRGHLSNSDCGSLCAELIGCGTTHFILGHLSRENNTPETAEYAVESEIAKKGYQRNRDYLLSCAPVETSGGFVSF